MAQTKRKRRSKHRGNAAGKVEARGRTGRPPSPEERKRATRTTQRQIKPPSWNSALTKALLMSALLFILTRVGIFGKDVPISQSVVLSVFALVLYTPLAYMTDKWVYTRQQRRQSGGR